MHHDRNKWLFLDAGGLPQQPGFVGRLLDDPIVIVIAIHFEERIALCSDNSIVPIGTMFDVMENEVDDTDIAVSAVIELPNGMFEVIEFSDFEPVVLS